MPPKISVLLCTVRPDKGYVNHPEWNTLKKIVDDLGRQTFKDFELVIVDGLRNCRANPVDSFAPGFSYTWVEPTPSFWTEHKKVAICRYRNTGIARCRGELIVNLDDCCELPPRYLECFWLAWSKYKTCLSAIWPESGDSRADGPVAAMPSQLHPTAFGTEIRPQPQVYGFGSYPREVALKLNGYNEWYDGAQGLEDFDWSTRLVQAGVKMVTKRFPGFKIHAQSGHDPRVISPEQPLLKCCNLAWWAARVRRTTSVVNQPYGQTVAAELVGPCSLLNEDGMCRHHCDTIKCGYLPNGFADVRHEQAWEGVMAESKGFKLEELR